MLPDVIFLVGGGQHFAFVDKVDFERLQNLGLGKMSDAGFGHYGDAHRLHNFTNDARRSHARHASIFANVGGHAFEGHDGAGSRLFGDARLIGGGDVHDDAALQHFGQAHFHAPLICRRASVIVTRIHVSSPDFVTATSVALTF